MLKVWGRASSSNVQALMWCIGELELEYERKDVGLFYGGNDTSEFLAMNPNGTVPVLQDEDDLPIWETGAILRYLSSNYGGETFWPTGKLHVRIDQWAEWSKINIAMGFTVPVFWRVVRTAPSRRDPVAIKKAIASLNKYLVIAERQFEKHEYLASSGLTLADIQFGHILYRYFDIDIERTDFPALRVYYERLTKRPAFRKHVMVSYEELRVDDQG